MDPFDPKNLVPGDMLLHCEHGYEISKLIAWAGSSPYSHASVVYDDKTMREASAAGVRSYDLSKRFADKTNYLYVDVYRRTEEPKGLAPAEVAAVRKVADGYMGVPYPLDELFFLGVICAARDKIPTDKTVRWVLRIVTDWLVDSKPDYMVCSELVYRCYAEAKVNPSIKPEIDVPDLSDTPFPDIDLPKLIQEVWDLLHPKSDSVMPPVPVNETDAESEAKLRANYAKVRTLIGADTRSVSQDGGPRIPESDPNPRLIMPSDLMNSPDFTVLGRITISS